MVGRVESDGLVGRALELGRHWGDEEAVAELVSLAGGQRRPLEAARDALVARLHRDPGDFGATAALRLVLRALDRADFEMGA
jgi:hypothetical protein